MGLEDVLAENDLRMTQPRRLVWEVLTGRNTHMTAQAIAAAVHEKDRTVNTSSVYRTLSLYADLGLARESTFGEDGSRWEPAHSDEMIHLVCESCETVDHHGGEIVNNMRQHLEADHGFTTTQVSVVVKGVCQKCSDT